MKHVESVCTYCGVGCDIVGNVQDNRIVSIHAEKDGYVSQGKLCIKGKQGFDFVHSGERIRQPLIKKSFLKKNKKIAKKIEGALIEYDETYYTADLDTVLNAAAMKLNEIKQEYGPHSFGAIGGARTSCESAYLFQKFTRESIGSPNVDCCARVCHSPSLRGMKETIGEGAATNPYNDIYEAEFIVCIGTNTTEAHPIVANRILDAAKQHNNLAVIDVRKIHLANYAKYNAVAPYEANLLILNMMAYVILDEELYDKKFIDEFTVGFKEYKKSILKDPYANPAFFEKIKGYEHLAKTIPNIAREYAIKKSMIFWGLGITEHIDGSYAVMAITHLALITGNIGKSGSGLMPLRGQNNVQGACDMGCLPYYLPDYQKPKEIGLMTPDMINAMLEGSIKALLNMGEDVLHIHPNVNKSRAAVKKLEFLMVQELFMTEIAKEADIVIGVKSAYEKTGVYVNAMRRLHLSQPLVESDLPDDWEVLKKLDNALGGEFEYANSNEIWNEVRESAPRRFYGASYMRLTRHRKRGLQWPVYDEDTPRLHLYEFRTPDGMGRFSYHRYELRNQVKALVEKGGYEGFYLTTGRTTVHYNNAAQTKVSDKLNKKYPEDIVLASVSDKERIKSDIIILKSRYGQSAPLSVKFSNTIKHGTLYSTFHHAASGINCLFGDEADVLVKTACFKSVKVEVEPA